MDFVHPQYFGMDCGTLCAVDTDCHGLKTCQLGDVRKRGRSARGHLTSPAKDSTYCLCSLGSPKKEIQDPIFESDPKYCASRLVSRQHLLVLIPVHDLSLRIPLAFFPLPQHAPPQVPNLERKG